jgi:hypothetical protein
MKRSVIVQTMTTFGFLSVALLSMNSTAQAEDDVRRVVTARSPLTKSLGGGPAGELLLNTKVNVLEEKGVWARVTTEGWVRTNSLSEKTAATSSAPAPVSTPKVEQGVLKVSEFVRSSRTDISPPKEYIVLTVSNDSTRTVTGWTGLLVAVTKDNKSVFRERVSESALDWKPGQKRDVTISWQPGETGYDAIQSVIVGEHTAMLLDVQINQ